MPELPDITVYVEALRPRVVGCALGRIRFASPFLLRSAVPPIAESYGRRVREVRRLGKRIVFALDGDYFLVLHLMVAGRLKWAKPGAGVPGRIGLCAFDFDCQERAQSGGTLLLTEASTKKRASLHLASGTGALAEFDRGGLEPLDSTAPQFAAALRRENHTLKRALTDPRLLSGIGNAYSDEILHRAKLSPVALTHRLTDQHFAALYKATVAVLVEWTDRLRAETGAGFPEKVTAFRKGMAVHGKYGQPCPVCGAKVQRIKFADNEHDYCPTCQTGGRLLADRSLSRLLKGDWPKTPEEMEERRAAAREILAEDEEDTGA